MQKLLTALTLVLLACGHSARVVKQPTPTLKQLTQVERAVRVEKACVSGDPYSGPTRLQDLRIEAGGWGSGVIVGPDTVLTAWHVVKCPPRTSRFLLVSGPDNVKHWAELAAGDPDHDIARLTVAGTPATRLKLAAAKDGDVVCAAVAHPIREWSCGVVIDVGPVKTKTNGTVDIWHTARTVPGNSGAGLYNGRGQLVGLQTNGDATKTDGGLATSVFGRVP